MGCFCTFWLRNLLCATTACNCSSLISPDGSAPTALASLLFDPPEPQNIGKKRVFRDVFTFSRTCIFFLQTLSLLWSSFFSSLLFSSLLVSSLLFSSLLKLSYRFPIFISKWQLTSWHSSRCTLFHLPPHSLSVHLLSSGLPSIGHSVTCAQPQTRCAWSPQAGTCFCRYHTSPIKEGCVPFWSPQESIP